jgi:DNA methylase
VKPYFATDDGIELYLGKCEDVLPELGVTADLVLTDCPYGETSLGWDRWVDGWPALAATASTSMWAFGSMRMFGEHWAEFTAAGWRMSQDVIGRDADGDAVFGDTHVVWEKPEGTSLAADRFRRVHEHALHWYRGPWGAVRHETPRVAHHGADNGRRSKGGSKGAHLGVARTRQYADEGTRLMRSVIRVANMRQRAIAPTEKPLGILEPLIRYSCPTGGLVLDLFAGSGSTLEAARGCGRRAIGVEADEAQIEKAARRLSQGVLDLGGAA